MNEQNELNKSRSLAELPSADMNKNQDSCSVEELTQMVCSLTDIVGKQNELIASLQSQLTKNLDNTERLISIIEGKVAAGKLIH